METETTELASKKKYFLVRKSEQSQTLNFFLVPTFLSAGLCLRKGHLWSAPPKLWLVNFRLLTSSKLVFNYKSLLYHISPSFVKNMCCLLTSASCRRWERLIALAPHTWSSHLQFSLIIFNYHMYFGLTVQWLSSLVIYLFNFSFLWTAQLRFSTSVGFRRKVVKTHFGKIEKLIFIVHIMHLKHIL